MLVIVSDLHLNDHTTGSPLDPEAFHVFAERLQELAYRASWRMDGRYKPIERIDLVLLGDVLDLLRSTYWLSAGARPWDDPASPAFADAVGKITDNILRENREACSVLRSLATDGSLRICPSTQSGQPVYGAEGVPISVRLFYMVGNHDWMLHLPGQRFDAVRQRLASHLGLASSPHAPFPHDPSECDELLSLLRRYRVLARHGDIFDPINFSDDRKVSSLGDAVVIELLTRFAAVVQQQLGDELPVSVLVGLSELDHVRPLLLAPVWLEGLLARSGVRPALRKEVKRAWDALADEFLDLSIVREFDSWSPFDMVDGMANALKFSKRLSIGWASKTLAWLQGLRGSAQDSYYQHALAEQDFRNRRARHIVYGHTHRQECVPLDASFADGYVLNQMYLNAGTWRRVLQQTRWAAQECEFIAHETMSLLCFYHGDERGGRPFETWTGTLALPGDVTVYRLDAGRAHASEQSLSTSRLPVAAPHFRHSPASSRSAYGSSY